MVYHGWSEFIDCRERLGRRSAWIRQIPTHDVTPRGPLHNIRSENEVAAIEQVSREVARGEPADSGDQRPLIHRSPNLDLKFQFYAGPFDDLIANEVDQTEDVLRRRLGFGDDEVGVPVAHPGTADSGIFQSGLVD